MQQRVQVGADGPPDGQVGRRVPGLTGGYASAWVADELADGQAGRAGR